MKILQAKCDFVTYAEHKFVHVFCMCIHLHVYIVTLTCTLHSFTILQDCMVSALLYTFFFTFFPKSLLQTDGGDEEMKDDIDSVRGLLDRLKEEKERELLKEVNCSNNYVSI